MKACKGWGSSNLCRALYNEGADELASSRFGSLTLPKGRAANIISVF